MHDIEEQQDNSPTISSPLPGVAPGMLLSGRFLIEAFLGQGGWGPLFRAHDQKTKQPMAIRFFAPDVTPDAAQLDRLRMQVKIASSLQHKNIASLFGMGKEGEYRYLAMEFIDGNSLRHLLSLKKRAGKSFSLTGAYNVLAHLCNALYHGHQATAHGLPGPGSVLINRIGRVKLCEYGLFSALLPESDVITRLGDNYCLAPEVRDAPSAASPAGDIYSLGVLLYHLLSGEQLVPGQEIPPLRTLVPEIPADIETIVSRCLDQDPKQRFHDPKELKDIFYESVQRAGTQANIENLLVTAKPDAAALNLVNVLSASPVTAQPFAPAQSGPANIAPPPPQAAPARPVMPAGSPQPLAGMSPPRPPTGIPAGRPPGPPVQNQAPLMVGAPLGGAPAGIPAAMPPGMSMRSVEQIMAEGAQDESEIWLIQKNRLDFGPFTQLNLKKAILKGEFGSNDFVLNQDNGERSTLGKHPLFRELCIHAERMLAIANAQKAEHEQVHQDRKRRAVVLTVMAISLVIVVGAGAFIAWRLTKDPQIQEKVIIKEKKVKDENLEALISRLEIAWKAEPQDQAKKRAKLARRGKGKGGAAGAADDNIMRLGDASKGGGDALLSQPVVQEVMQKNMRKLIPCIYQEMRSNASLRQVTIDFGIRGTGQVGSVKVNDQSSGSLQSCVQRQMASIKFPAFDGSLTLASFSMSLK